MTDAAPKVPAVPESSALTYYDDACQKLAKAARLDDVKEIHDQAAAQAEYARRAKNRDLEADAVVIRLRATRMLDQLRQAQKETVGLSQGGRPAKTGLSKNPVLPTLTMQGIDKNLAHQGRVLGALSEEKFKEVCADTHDKVARAARNVVREIEIEQEREAYRARTYEGCTVDDLRALAASGFKAGSIYVDVPSRFETYSGKGKQRSAERYYDTEGVAELMAMGPLIKALAAKDCALHYWASGATDEQAHEIIRAWEFEYKTWGFVWIKTEPGAEVITLAGKGLHQGLGYSTRANTEVVLLAKRGAPLRLNNNVNQAVIAPVAEHSAKPEEVRRRIERLYPGPHLELFGRKPVPGWTVWGNEINRSTWDVMWQRPFGLTDSEREEIEPGGES